MVRFSFFPLLLVLLSLLCVSNGSATRDGSEQWGYARVRPKAHMFWWLYRSPKRVENGAIPWPTVLWLQGGPGASGVGYGNFGEIGPLDTNLKPRESTWLQKADLLFVDNPVGTGYSFVEDKELLVKTDEEAASDLTALLKKLYNKNEKLQKSPLFIAAESYGGKFAATAGVSIVKAIKAGKLKLKFGGVALGNSWISPEDFVFSWGPLLLDVSRLDKNGEEQSNNLARKIQHQLEEGLYLEAESSWNELEGWISSSSNFVDFYNFLQDDAPFGSTMAIGTSKMSVSERYSRYLSSKASFNGSLSDLMNTVIKEKLKIIPKNVSWGGQSDDVFDALRPAFMKPSINEVDELLSFGVNVTIYNGQLDLICATKGAEAWVQKLKWKGLKNFNSLNREPLYCDGDETGATKAFVKSHKNLHFYWILGAGHFVPVDQPCIALKMVSDITQSPAAAV
ncbi:serine carboxypeptidase-like 51 [Typha latifolia]|uniref:serine carboxypeptidase-like 51 n=1 Tax=Typha latifolia TaxID=4733 RepID=UPI003C2C42D8